MLLFNGRQLQHKQLHSCTAKSIEGLHMGVQWLLRNMSHFPCTVHQGRESGSAIGTVPLMITMAVTYLVIITHIV